MKYIILSVLMSIISLLSYAQTTPTKNTPSITDNKKEIYSYVEQMPEYPGGNEGLRVYLSKNIHYPKSAKKHHVEGIVYIQFVVTDKGTIDDIKVLRTPDNSLTKAAVRVIKKMPKWEAGKQNNVPVSVYYTLPVNFKLSSR